MVLVHESARAHICKNMHAYMLKQRKMHVSIRICQEDITTFLCLFIYAETAKRGSSSTGGWGNHPALQSINTKSIYKCISRKTRIEPRSKKYDSQSTQGFFLTSSSCELMCVSFFFFQDPLTGTAAAEVPPHCDSNIGCM